MNCIPQDQNSPLELRRLAAQRQLYSKAKGLLAFQMVLSVPIAVTIAAAALWNPAARVYAGIWGILATFVDLVWLSPWQQSLKNTAATVQEAFDCDLLHLPWNETTTGKPPAAEIVAEWSILPRGVTYETLQLLNWYPSSIGELPLHVARIVCQRCNCWWDSNLRRRYAIWCIGIVATLFAVPCLGGTIAGVPLQQLALIVVLPLAPVATVGIRQFREQRDAAERLDSLRDHFATIWQRLLNGGVSPEESREVSRRVQDRIFEHRRRTPLIFDWVYRKLRRKQETAMQRTAEELIGELRRANVSVAALPTTVAGPVEGLGGRVQDLLP